MSFAAELTALASVIAIDVTLAGDNAVVIGIAAAGLAPEQRRKAILWGIAAAAGLRIVFSVFAVQLLGIIGLLFAGGLLLLWVSWKLWRELREGARGGDGDEAAADAPPPQPKRMGEAVKQIILADVSMSLDNVLAVAGAARDHVWVMVLGLALSVALTGAAAEMVARILKKWHWIAYVGLGIIVVVALRMIWDGARPLLTLAQGL